MKSKIFHENFRKILPVHVQFRQIEDCEANEKWLVYQKFCLLHFHCSEILSEEMSVHEVGLKNQFEKLLSCIYQVNGCALLLIFAGFAENRVVHEFEEIFFKLGFGLRSLLLIERDVWGHPFTLTVANSSVHLSQFEAMTQIEFEIPIIYYIFLFV